MTDGSVIAPVTIAMVGAPPPKEQQAAGKKQDGSVQIPYYEDLKD